MGEARRRGPPEERRRIAVQRNKAALISLLGDRDERADAILRAGITPFLSKMTSEEWQTRRSRILEALKQVSVGTKLAEAKPIRVRDDEIAWYLFLCQQVLEDPLCIDVSQVAPAAPFFAGIGERWVYANRVKGLYHKIDEVLHKYRKDPDGLIFEILVALSYAAAGWDVELLEVQPPVKSPDMRVTKRNIELYVECKRLARRTSYAEQERKDFLSRWDVAKQVLLQKRQWVWFKGIFHVEAASLPSDYLAEVFQRALPIGAGERLIHNDNKATIYARLIDQAAVHRHLAQWRVKKNSLMLSRLLGGDWAPTNSSTTILKIAKTSRVVDCDVSVLGGYIDEIDWACGFTRDFDSSISLDKKAKDVTKHLADAVNQVPDDKPSVIHIAAETLEGQEVERLRTEKVMETVSNFITNKPVIAVRFHRFQANQTIDKLWEFDETVNQFQVDNLLIDDIPLNVVVSETVEMREGGHWELYK